MGFGVQQSKTLPVTHFFKKAETNKNRNTFAHVKWLRNNINTTINMTLYFIKYPSLLWRWVCGLF
jgi:hypothetical protein